MGITKSKFLFLFSAQTTVLSNVGAQIPFAKQDSTSQHAEIINKQNIINSRYET